MRPGFTDVDLGRLSLFAGLKPDVLKAVAEGLEWIALPGGAVLFEEGDPGDAVYVVASGALAAFRRQRDGERFLGSIAAGETVGEMALISGRRRVASVRALRDSEVVRFRKADFERLLATHPKAMLHLMRTAMVRLEDSLKRAGLPRVPRAIALVPTHGGLEVEPWAVALAEALGRFGPTALVREAPDDHRSPAWYHRLEQAHRALIYVADEPRGPWTELCKRQADAVLYLIDAAAPERIEPRREGMLPGKTERLLLLHPGEIRAGAAAVARTRFPGLPHHHLRGADDVRRLARVLAGRAVGLVLSGGGARGFAHLGVVRALREAGLELDYVGGTSIGAVIGAGVASEWDDDSLQDAYRRTFVDTNPLSDYTVPFVSLVAGRKATRLLQQTFGTQTIEDLPIPFYCLSANLTRGRAHEHHDGALWKALRASIAIPGVLPPVFEGGEVLVDGGVINNLPVDVMRRLNAGPILSVDIGGQYGVSARVDEVEPPPLWRMVREHYALGRPRPGIFSILLRAGMVNSQATAAHNREYSSLLLEPPVGSIELLAWREFERAIQIGYEYARSALRDLPEGLRPAAEGEASG